MLAALNRLFERRQVGAGQIFLDRRMRGRFADKQKVATGIQNRLAKELTGDQIIAEMNHIELVANVVVGWNSGSPEQTVGIKAAIPFS